MSPRRAPLRGRPRTVALALALALAAPSPLAASQDRGSALARFGEALSAVRGGAADARAELAASARALADGHQRPDALEVAEEYLSMSPGGLARGLEREERFLALRDRVADAGRRGVDSREQWRAVREAAARDLRALAEEGQDDEDVAPAARAWSLLAMVLLDRYELDSDVDDGERGRLGLEIEDCIAHSLELFARAGQVTPTLEPLWLRARFDRARGDSAAARRGLQDLLATAQSVWRDEYRERALLGLVDLAEDVGDVREAEALLARVAEFRDPRESWPLARAHAQHLIAADQPELALSFLWSHEPSEAAFRPTWRGLLATAYLRTGDYAAARRELASATGGEYPRLARATLALAEGDPQAVLDDLAGDEGTATWSAAGRARAAALSGEAWLDVGRPHRARAELHRALDLARERRLEDGEGDGSILGEWLGVHTLVLAARATALDGDPLAAAALLEDEQSRRLRPADGGVSPDDVRAWAARYEGGLVTWAIGADQSLVVHVAADGHAVAAPVPVGRRALEGAVRRLREAAQGGDQGRAQALAAELSSTVLPEPVASALADGPPDRRVLFLLHGPLERAPLALLPLAGAPLDERLTEVVLPGLLPLATDAPALGPDTCWWLLGGPVDPGSDEVLLPGAARELAQLALRRTSAHVSTGKAFVRGACEAALAQGCALHFASHLVPDPLSPDGRLAPVGLLLSDGQVLSAEDVLAAGSRAPLVVLSACATAEGRAIDGEGVHGLGRAFLEGGARNVLVTLWPVEDAGAAEFALEFHAALGRGLEPSRAARAARRALAERGHGLAVTTAFRALGRD